MKKIYKAPTTKIHNVGVHHMLCLSDPDSLTGPMGTDSTDPTNPNNNLGKEYYDFGW